MPNDRHNEIAARLAALVSDLEGPEAVEHGRPLHVFGAAGEFLMSFMTPASR
jgi:hypothetical protein